MAYRPWVMRRAELLTSPVFALSILVLLVNDHVLKAAWPGLVTGKLSDVAGVAMIAILLTAVLGRREVGFGLTVAGFALLKTVPIAAVWASPVLGGVTRTDPTDLVALLVLIPVGYWAGSNRPAEIETYWSLPARIVMVTAAVFATTATSCSGEGVSRLAVDDGVVYVETSNSVFESGDGGVTWRNTEQQSWEDSFADLDFGIARNCVGEERCVAITRSSGPDLGVAVQANSPDGREPILVVTDQDLQALTDLLRPTCEGVYPEDATIVDRPDGTHVVVTLGEAGVLHRSPDERWEWAAVGEFGLTASQLETAPFGVGEGSVVGDDPWGGLVFQLATVVLLLIGPLVALAIIPIRRLARRRGRDPGNTIGLCVGAAILLELVGLGLVVLTGIGGDHQPRVVVAIVMLSIAAACAAALIAWQARSRRDETWQPPDVSHRVG